MSNQQNIINLIKRISGQKNNLVVNTAFIDYMGSIEGGLFLSQLIYWSDKGKRHDGWFYKTYQDFYNEIRLSEYQCRKSIKICEANGFLKTKIKKANGNPTLHYKIDVNAFSSSFLKFLSFDSEKTSGTLTETTTNTHNLNHGSITPYMDLVYSDLADRKIKL